VESTTPFDLTGVLILVIDSDPAVLQAMETLLAKWNCEVIAAASGEEMKQKLATAPRVPSLIISDYRPRGPARLGTTPTVAVIEMLRNEFNSEIPAVLLTGDTATERSARAQEVAGLPVLHKPLNPARLRTLIANLLRIDETQERSRWAS
jgi:CheY-like chemotaxis protein